MQNNLCLFIGKPLTDSSFWDNLGLYDLRPQDVEFLTPDQIIALNPNNIVSEPCIMTLRVSCVDPDGGVEDGVEVVAEIQYENRTESLLPGKIAIVYPDGRCVLIKNESVTANPLLTQFYFEGLEMIEQLNKFEIVIDAVNGDVNSYLIYTNHGLVAERVEVTLI